MTFHYIEFKTYCHATEDIQKVKEVLSQIAGEGLELDIEISEAEGYYGNPIEILETTISRNRDMDDFFDHLPKDTVNELLETLEKRVDDRCNFYFRLDKEQAWDGDFSLVEGGNSISIRARIESYPAKRSSAIDILREYLKELTME